MRSSPTAAAALSASLISPGSSWPRSSASLGPGAGEAVGLQLEGDGVLVGLARVLLLQPADLAADAEDVLHVVAVLVGDDVLGGEVADGAELVLQLGQEVEVEVHELVGRAVERARSAQLAWPQPVLIAPEKKTCRASRYWPSKTCGYSSIQ